MSCVPQLRLTRHKRHPSIVVEPAVVAFMKDSGRLKLSEAEVMSHNPSLLPLPSRGVSQLQCQTSIASITVPKLNTAKQQASDLSVANQSLQILCLFESIHFRSWSRVTNAVSLKSFDIAMYSVYFHILSSCVMGTTIAL